MPTSRYAFPFDSNTPAKSVPTVQPGTTHSPNTPPPTLGSVPLPTTPDAVIALKDLIGDDAVALIAANGLRFQATGDTGLTSGREQEEIALAMAKDFAGPEAEHPAFFLHLGDVIYGAGKDAAYIDEFYRPYADYPGKIIAVPGNHDGEIKRGTDPVTLAAFWANFCDRQPHVAHSVEQVGVQRATMDQPGVYWWLQTPVADVIGLYSNWDENFGYLQGASKTADGAPDATQLDWLTATLAKISATTPKKALIFAMHHPPYSAGGHTGSPKMIADIDAACQHAGLHAHLVISGHAHNYQRYTRDDGTKFIVAGIGGHGSQHVPAATSQKAGRVTFESSFEGYGYLFVTVTATAITVQARSLAAGNRLTTLDQVTIPLA